MQCNAGELIVYTDGSLLGPGTDGCQAGSGIVVFDGGEIVGEAAVQIAGWRSSTKAEVYGCLAALAALPSECLAQVFTVSHH